MNSTKLKFLLSALLLVVLPSSYAMAQYKVDTDKVEIVKVTSPDLGGNLAKKSFDPKDWMEIEMKINIEAKDKDKLFADKVTVKWFIAAKNPAKGSSGYILIEREVTHVNVPIGEDVYVSVYLSPNSIMRLSGSDRFNKSDINDAGGEILIEGQQPVDTKKGYFSMDKKPGWWTSGSLSRYDKIPLLTKDETPFKIFWYSRYAELEEEK
jgi:hypothetical protein